LQQGGGEAECSVKGRRVRKGAGKRQNIDAGDTMHAWGTYTAHKC